MSTHRIVLLITDEELTTLADIQCVLDARAEDYEDDGMAGGLAEIRDRIDIEVLAS